jgi:hypothetical protein
MHKLLFVFTIVLGALISVRAEPEPIASRDVRATWILEELPKETTDALIKFL